MYASDIRHGMTPGRDLFYRPRILRPVFYAWRCLMRAEFIAILEIALYVVMGAGLVLAAVGLWVSFNQDKLSD